FKIPAVLISRFVRERGREESIEFRDAPCVPHIVVSKTCDAKCVGGLCLDAGGRNPPHAIHFERSAVLLIDHPIDLWKKNGLLANSRHGAKFAKQTVQSIVIGCDRRSIVGECQIAEESASPLGSS